MKRIYNYTSEKEFRKASESKLIDYFNNATSKAANIHFNWFGNLILNTAFLLLMIFCCVTGLWFTVVFRLAFIQSGEIRNKKYFLYSLILFFVGLTEIILFLIVKPRRKKILHKTIRNNINQVDIFKLIFSGLNGIELISLDPDIVSDKLSLYSIFEMPLTAKFERHSSLMHFKIFDKYLGYVQTGNYEWASTFDKHSSSVRKATGFTEIQDNSSPKYIFSLINPISLSKMNKIHLENNTFVETFSPCSIDRVTTRMAFTPLSMEEMLKAESKLKIKKWNLEKNKNGFLINFEPIDVNQLIIDSESISEIINKKSNISKVVNSLIEDVFTDVYQWYLLLCMALIPIV